MQSWAHPTVYTKTGRLQIEDTPYIVGSKTQKFYFANSAFFSVFSGTFEVGGAVTLPRR